MARIRLLFLTLGLAILLTGALLALDRYRHRLAPEVTFVSISGERLPLSGWRGHPVLVTFWATDCPSCLKEIPLLIRLRQEYVPRGLRLVAVAMRYDLPSRVVGLAREMNLPYPVALDPSGAHARAFGEVQLTPTTFLIAPNGRVEDTVTGLLDESVLRRQIDSLLQEP
jgi:thiol-disulfide isomerase/thioredoxin